MNRRELLLGSALALVATRAAADTKKPTHKASPELLTASSQCIGASDACLAHCIEMLGAGNTSMAACARSVSDLIPSVVALASMASRSSPHTAAMSALVADVARDCKAECDKHATMSPCKACSDSCVALLAAIAKA